MGISSLICFSADHFRRPAGGCCAKMAASFKGNLQPKPVQDGTARALRDRKEQ